MKATKKEIKQWLETQIGVMYVQNQRLTLTEKIDYLSDARGEIVPDIRLRNVHSSDYLHIDAPALRYVANLLELPIAVEDRDGDELYPYELSFYYNEVKFIALETEEEYKERGELA